MSNFVVGSEIFVSEFVKQNKILPGLEGFVRYMFFELENDGYFQVRSKQIKEALTFKLVKDLPSLDKVKEEIELVYKIVHPASPNEIGYISSTGTRLTAMLTGKESALPYLFPEDPSAISAEQYYMTSCQALSAHELLNGFMGEFLKVSDGNK